MRLPSENEMTTTQREYLSTCQAAVTPLPETTQKTGGAYLIDMRAVSTGAVLGVWFCIWESDDGHDTADYLRELTQTQGTAREYRMRYKESKNP